MTFFLVKLKIGRLTFLFWYLFKLTKIALKLRLSFPLNSVLTRQTSAKVAFKSGLDYFLECFIASTFAWIISVLPENFKKFWHQPSPAIQARKPIGTVTHNKTSRKKNENKIKIWIEHLIKMIIYAERPCAERENLSR